jgi:glycosyltransferase involved in cell wall biosynthesis
MSTSHSCIGQCNQPLKVLQAHNYHLTYGGMEVMYEHTVRLLQEEGHEVVICERNNADIITLRDKVCAVTSSFCSGTARRHMAALLQRERPDIVHVHNVYPLLSPSILNACRDAAIPVVMACQDYSLTCPAAHHLRSGKPCESCLGGKEYWCAVKNCRSSVPLSVTYALRTAWARHSRSFIDGVTLFICPTDFARRKLAQGGIPLDRIVCLPHMAGIHADSNDAELGEYVAYVGRISPEKGISTLTEAARLSDLPIRAAGPFDEHPNLLRNVPPNLKFVGRLAGEELTCFYRKARLVVVPSVCYETFGLVAAEAMGHGKPVVASRIGGLPEVVDDRANGLLFEPGSATDLSEKMLTLWGNAALCRSLGRHGRNKCLREYSQKAHYRRLVDIYRRAILMTSHGAYMGAGIESPPRHAFLE